MNKKLLLVVTVIIIIGILGLVSSLKIDVGSLIHTGLTGQGNAYACIDSGGVLFRSITPCV